jgi:hypothetical protein
MLAIRSEVVIPADTAGAPESTRAMRTVLSAAGATSIPTVPAMSIAVRK